MWVIIIANFILHTQLTLLYTQLTFYCMQLLLLTFYYTHNFFIITNNYIIWPEAANSIFLLPYLISKVILIRSISNTCQRMFSFPQGISFLWITSDPLWNTLKNVPSQGAFCTFKGISLSILNMSYSLLYIMYK